MSPNSKSLFVSLGVVVAAGSVVVGSYVRDRVDLGMRTLPNSQRDFSMQSLVASRDPDQQVPEGDFFYELTRLVKREYVEPITDDQKLASGAVRGMVGSLGDPSSLFMDKSEFTAFLNSREGKYEGIGAELALVNPAGIPSGAAGRGNLQPTDEGGAEEMMATMPKIPRLTLVAVVPGGPADKAGLKVGDMVYSVDDHWLVNSDLLDRFRAAQIDWAAKKITLRDLNKLRKEIRTKTDRALLPLRAKDRLMLGTTGTLKVTVDRAKSQLTVNITRGTSSMPNWSVKGDHVDYLPFTPGAADRLKDALQGKKEVTLDLRNNVLGEVSVMRDCLATIAPAGTYGGFINQRGTKPTPLTLTKGVSSHPKIHLITDFSTRGAAEMFALALTSNGLATMTQPTGNQRKLIDIIKLPDGSGYTLATGEYRTKLSVPTATAKKGVK